MGPDLHITIRLWHLVFFLLALFALWHLQSTALEPTNGSWKERARHTHAAGSLALQWAPWAPRKSGGRRHGGGSCRQIRCRPDAIEHGERRLRSLCDCDCTHDII